jgi:hypothetical protein
VLPLSAESGRPSSRCDVARQRRDLQHLRRAAELMSRVLGMPGYEFMVIPHPVSSADDAALENMAAATAARMAQMLVRL